MASEPRELVADAVRERAMNGELPHLGSYSYRKDGPRGRSVHVPKIVDQNVDAEPDEDSVEMFGDLSEGILVVDFRQEDDA